MATWNLPFFILILLMTILASVNCNGLRCPDKRKLAFSFFKRNRFDIIFLQETHWSIDLDMQIKREWEGDAFFFTWDELCPRCSHSNYVTPWL